MRKFRNLWHRMDDCDYTQTALARAIRVAQATLSDRMCGKSPFDTWEMDAIGRCLDIPREEYHLYFFDLDHKEVRR